jgi:hypothetical protein
MFSQTRTDLLKRIQTVDDLSQLGQVIVSLHVVADRLDREDDLKIEK